MTCAQLGRMDEAQAEAAELLRVDPNYSIPGRSRRILGFKSAKTTTLLRWTTQVGVARVVGAPPTRRAEWIIRVAGDPARSDVVVRF